MLLIINNIFYNVKIILFLFVNYTGTLFLPKIRNITLGNIRITPFKKYYLKEVNEIFKSWWNYDISKKNILLLKYFGSKLCFLIINKKNEVIGFIILYFTFFDIVNRTIHSAYGCIKSVYRDYGYGSILFLHAWHWFSRINILKGISARYSVDNKSSIKLHQKAGFKNVEEYVDNNRNRKVYSVCLFDDNQNKERLNVLYQKIKTIYSTK
jgi:RimJ/RimL family protein N-acetyltransferase